MKNWLPLVFGPVFTIDKQPEKTAGWLHWKWHPIKSTNQFEELKKKTAKEFGISNIDHRTECSVNPSNTHIYIYIYSYLWKSSGPLLSCFKVDTNSSSKSMAAGYERTLHAAHPEGKTRNSRKSHKWPHGYQMCMICLSVNMCPLKYIIYTYIQKIYIYTYTYVVLCKNLFLNLWLPSSWKNKTNATPSPQSSRHRYFDHPFQCR